MHAAVLAAAVAIAVSQASDWLPPSVAKIVTQQLVERLEQIDLGWSRERATGAATSVVASIARRLEAAGEAEVLKRAPALAPLNLPSSGDARLDAMARYQMCVSVYYVRHELRAKEASEDARIAAVMGLTAGSMAMLYLRQRLVDAAVPEDRIEKFLTGDSFERSLQRMQRDAAVLMAIQEECAPVFRALIQGETGS